MLRIHTTNGGIVDINPKLVASVCDAGRGGAWNKWGVVIHMADGCFWVVPRADYNASYASKLGTPLR